MADDPMPEALLDVAGVGLDLPLRAVRRGARRSSMTKEEMLAGLRRALGSFQFESHVARAITAAITALEAAPFMAFAEHVGPLPTSAMASGEAPSQVEAPPVSVLVSGIADRPDIATGPVRAAKSVKVEAPPRESAYDQQLGEARAHDADVWPPLWPDDNDVRKFVPFRRWCGDSLCPWCYLGREHADNTRLRAELEQARGEAADWENTARSGVHEATRRAERAEQERDAAKRELVMRLDYETRTFEAAGILGKGVDLNTAVAELRRRAEERDAALAELDKEQGR